MQELPHFQLIPTNRMATVPWDVYGCMRREPCSALFAVHFDTPCATLVHPAFNSTQNNRTAMYDVPIRNYYCFPVLSTHHCHMLPCLRVSQDAGNGMVALVGLQKHDDGWVICAFCLVNERAACPIDSQCDWLMLDLRESSETVHTCRAQWSETKVPVKTHQGLCRFVGLTEIKKPGTLLSVRYPCTTALH